LCTEAVSLKKGKSIVHNPEIIEYAYHNNMTKKEYFKAYSAVYLVLVKGKKILLSRRFHTGYQDGKYSLVAGHLEGNETVKQGIIRETREEINLVLDPEDLEVAHVMHRRSPDREYFDIYLCAEKWKGDMINKEPDKCDDLVWFEFDSLPENMVPEVRLALENVYKGVYYGEFGWSV